MRSEDRDAITKLYEDRYQSLGYSVETLGWGSIEDQRLRFDVLCEVGDLSDSSICDVGCGFGDLVPYLRNRYTNVTYVGTDITRSFVQRASILHPGDSFRCIDILEGDFGDHFDYFLLSGALNFRIDDNFSLTKNMIERMFSLANKGVAINFLTSYVNFERDHNYHHSPERVFSFAQTLSRWVRLRHDYPLWEFTLYLYKTPQG